VSEELENSLQQAIETYLGQRLRAIEEQISQLQTEFGEALTRLRSSAVGESLSGTALSASIFAHFQAARAQQLTGAAALEEAPGSGEIAAIRRAVEQIEKQRSQAEVLSTLLVNVAGFADRVALFVIKNEQAIGWRICEASDPTNLEAIRGVVLPLSSENLLSQAVRSRALWNGAPESHSGNRALMDQLGGSPQNLAAIPLIARGKVVAVLYADSASPDPNTIGLDAIELLARVAAMAVDLVASGHAPAAPVSEFEAAMPSAPAASEMEMPAPAQAPAVEEEIEVKPEPAYVPHVELQAPRVFVEPIVEPIDEQAVPEPVKAKVTESVEETLAEAPPETAAEEETRLTTEPEAPAAIEAAPEVQPTPPPAETEPAPELQPTPLAPGFTSPYAAPLGSSRRYGVTEPELPIEVGEEERRLHNDARRFARLLVSEIKLYNEPKVREGRNNGDLYDRLREDIDRSRQMYNKRVAPPVAARHDYFHQELVNTLAEGDPAKLGASYPGASVAVS
jgi:hypothetical protein